MSSSSLQTPGQAPDGGGIAAAEPWGGGGIGSTLTPTLRQALRTATEGGTVTMGGDSRCDVPTGARLRLLVTGPEPPLVHSKNKPP